MPLQSTDSYRLEKILDHLNSGIQSSKELYNKAISEGDNYGRGYYKGFINELEWIRQIHFGIDAELEQPPVLSLTTQI